LLQDFSFVKWVCFDFGIGNIGLTKQREKKEKEKETEKEKENRALKNPLESWKLS
jgi:hypothetical protein